MKEFYVKQMQEESNGLTGLGRGDAKVGEEKKEIW
jgi:hypothetical protein